MNRFGCQLTECEFISISIVKQQKYLVIGVSERYISFVSEKVLIRTHTKITASEWASLEVTL
jgi:hypothetical protein